MNRQAVLLLLLCGLVCCNASYLSSLSHLYGRARALFDETFLGEPIAPSVQQAVNITLQASPSGLVLVNEGVTLTATVSPPPNGATCNFAVFRIGTILGCDARPVVDGIATCQWPGADRVPPSGQLLIGVLCNNATAVPLIVSITNAQPQLTVAASTDKAPTGTPFLITATAFITQSGHNNQSQAASAGAKPLATVVPLPEREVTFTITSGSAALSPAPATTRSPHRAEVAANRADNTLTVTTDAQGIARALATGTGPGNLIISASLTAGSFITTNLGAVGITVPGVASVTLTPSLTEAHLGEPVSLTATALDDSGSPMAGVKICLVSAGQAQLEYYHPQRPAKSLCGVTDAQGKVTLTFTSKIPGTVGVVAAALQSGRGSVVSAPSHVMFWGHEHRQGDYDRREGWWRDEAYGTVATKLAMQAGTPAIRALP